MKQTSKIKDIHFTVQTITISNVINYLRSHPYPIIDMPYSNLWDNKKQSRFIELILIRFLLNPFYFDGSNNNRWMVVDGIQRLNTLKNFVIDNSLMLEGLELLPQFNGMKWEDLPRSEQRTIQESEVQACIIEEGTSDEVKKIFLQSIKKQTI